MASYLVGINTKIRAATVIVAVIAAAVLLLLSKPKESISNIQYLSGGGEEEIEMGATEIFGVKIERNPSPSKLTELGVTSWPKWGCGPSKFPWTFSAKETMYLLEGKVKVYCEGFDGSFEIGAGDLVEFPKGMKITWDVIEAVNKHYHLDK